MENNEIPLVGHVEYATILQKMQRYCHLSDDKILVRFGHEIARLNKYEKAYGIKREDLAKYV